MIKYSVWGYYEKGGYWTLHLSDLQINTAYIKMNELINHHKENCREGCAYNDWRVEEGKPNDKV